jgi:methylglutaconyl-CoA hydratase
MSEVVHLDIAGGVATITLDSPPNRNALSRQLTSELHAHMLSAIADPAVRIIVLTATGTTFCSGADLKEQREANASGGQTGPTALAPILTAMWDSPKPVIGRINGHARAGGLGLVAACDIAVGADEASFAVSEVRIGVIPAIISVVLLRKLAPHVAMELFLTGEPFSAAAAVEYGLLNRAVPAAGLDVLVEAYIDKLRKGGPGAVAGAKRLVREVPSMEMAPAFDAMAKLSAEFFASPEALEGMTAFAEKRPPSWATD